MLYLAVHVILFNICRLLKKTRMTPVQHLCSVVLASFQILLPREHQNSNIYSLSISLGSSSSSSQWRVP